MSLCVNYDYLLNKRNLLIEIFCINWSKVYIFVMDGWVLFIYFDILSKFAFLHLMFKYCKDWSNKLSLMIYHLLLLDLLQTKWSKKYCFHQDEQKFLDNQHHHNHGSHLQQLLFGSLNGRCSNWITSSVTSKKSQMSIKVSQKWLHKKHERFWHLYKISLKCG